MDIETDLLVIGGGMAGLVAGTVAAESGVSTVLLEKGQSATAYSSGAIDIMGCHPAALESFTSPKEGLIALTGLSPLHPYVIAKCDIPQGNSVDAIIERVRESVIWLKKHLEGTVAPLKGRFSTNINPITILGTTKPTCLIQSTMYASDFEDIEESVLLFAGITGYPDFNPSAAAKTYIEDRIALGKPPHKVSHCMLDITPFGKSFNISSIEIARHLDHEGSVEALANQLDIHVKRLGVTHVAIPPVLGLYNATKNKSKLEKLIGVEVFELLGFPPSIPGRRLQHALERMFVKAGGKILVGHEAISYVKSGQHVDTVIARSPRRKIKIQTKAVILATGKYIGGGIAGDEKGLRETVFGIMTVTGDFQLAGEIVPSRSTHRLSINPIGQPIQACGLSIDPQFRPVREDGLEWADNVFAAGAVLGGYNYAAEKSGLGVALVTGYGAGKSAIDYIKGEE